MKPDILRVLELMDQAREETRAEQAEEHDDEAR